MQPFRILNRHRLALPEILETRFNLAGMFALLPHDVSFAGRGGLAETRSAIVVDFDQDGDLDILASSRRTKQIVWVENLDGRGSFSDEQVLAETPEPVTRIQTIDLDADGDLDIVYQSFFGTSLTWLQQQPGRLFDSRTLIFSDSAISDFQLGDLNGDHDIDVVTAESDTDRIAWFAQQNGPEDFSDRKDISTSVDSVRSVALADIDGDGDLDVLSASALDDSVQWFENADGQGQFTEGRLINVPQRATSRVSFVTTADLDGDGDADVMTTSYLLGRVVWYENLGNSEFHSGRMLMDGLSRLDFNVAAIDADGDGDLDVFASPENEHEIYWVENLGDTGTFADAALATPRTERSGDILVADLDNDGDQDLVTVSNHEGLVAWHENRVVGDSNNDGRFDTADLVRIFQAGEYRDEIAMNSTFDEGDWNQDGEFDSSDLVFAFQAGTYAFAPLATAKHHLALPW